MAKPDVDKQLEQIRERLIVLKREASVCPEPTPSKRRFHTLLKYICAALFFLYPVTDTLDYLGPFVSVQSVNLKLTYSRLQNPDNLQVSYEFTDRTLLTIPTAKLWPLSAPSAPEMRYASSKIEFVSPPTKLQYSLAAEEDPTIDPLTFQLPQQISDGKTHMKFDAEGLFAKIDDLDETIIAVVDKSDQKLYLYENGLKKYSWEVSTARKGKVTPTGTWNAQWLSKHHKSSIYNNAPMPYSIFYHGNFAIHGTDQIGRLGTPASSGCVRLHPENAAVLYAMVEQVGKSDFAVRVID